MITVAHVVYALVTASIILVMLFRRGVIIPSLIGIFAVGWVYTGDVISGFKAVYNANLTAAKELFTIFLIITFMVALLNSLKDIGADRRMIQPIQKLIVNGHVAFFVLAGVTFLISLFFWPTPAVPLIGALLIPAAVRAGLPPIGAAMAIAMAGQGMALSSDYIMQVAPMLSATGAGVSTESVADKGMVLSLITGGIAIGGAYLMNRKAIRVSDSQLSGMKVARMEIAAASDKRDKQEAEVYPEAALTAETLPPSVMRWSKILAVLVPAAMLAIMIIMALTKFGIELGSLEGGDGAAFIGGVAALLLIISSIVFSKAKALDKIGDHLTEGFVFAFRAMGPIIPIAGFFFLGNADFSGSILTVGEGAAAPSFLFDLVSSVQSYIPSSGIIAGFSLLLVGILTGLDGSGFSGLPITGALSGSIASSVNVDPATLAAIGQMGAIWAGGGTIIAWSSLVAVAGFAGVSALELARKNFIPVMLGLVVSTIIAIVIW